MRIYEAADYRGMSRRAANIISAHVILKPACVLGLATGRTPVGAYQQLIEWYRKGDLSFRETRAVNLDEYRGLGPGHPQSYRFFMQEQLFSHIDIRPENTFIPDGLAPDGIDLQLLGIGRNGHIGFNEPGRAFELETHLVDLSASTRAANARFFPDGAEIPGQAFTMGIKSIMQARRILVAVSGAEKAEIVMRAFTGPVVPGVPCSILQLHPDVTLVGDRAALAALRKTGARICG
jgi:glucosamine-6-phosphate deaminase